MFQSAISPIRDMRGDFTVNIVSTPHFLMSPALTVETQPQTQLCLRLFEDSSVSLLSEWTTDSSSNDWTTDSEADAIKPEEQEPENEFRWSATP